jgi:mannose-6-phosphate isomerase-like protein (cupin superfamily)
MVGACRGGQAARMDTIDARGTMTTTPHGTLAPDTGGRAMVTEHVATRGSGSPLHVHHNEEEWFYVLEGELTIWVAGTTVVAGAGVFVYGPRDVPHTFVVSSERARFQLATGPAGFEGFIRARAVPAPEIPPAADQGIEILGPPGIPA